MSIASRLYNILRAEVRDRVRAGDTPQEPSIHLGKEAPESAASSESSQDPDMVRWYANLEVPYGSDLATVQAARKRLARRYHPDRHGRDPELQRTATELLKGLNDAYEQLRQRLEPSA